VLVPNVIASQVGLTYWNTQAVILNTGQASGYAKIYQNTVPDNANNNGDFDTLNWPTLIIGSGPL
jgi:hypothetical protein